MISFRRSLTLQLLGAVLWLCSGTTFATNDEQSVVAVEQLPITLSDEQIKWLSDHPVINIGAMNDWPPLSFVNLNGEPDGFGLALVNLINERLGGRLHLVSGDWLELYQGVTSSKLDALLDVTPRPEREAYFNFTEPYLNIPQVIIGRDEPPYYLQESLLAGKTIALEEGFVNVLFYSQNYPEIHIKEYSSTSEALGAVVRGEAEAYIGNRAVANYIIRNELISSLRVHGRANKDGSILAIGTRKDWPELRDILQVALHSISGHEFHAMLNDVIEHKTGQSEVNDVLLTNTEKQWLNDHPVIQLASDPSWPPLEYFNSAGVYSGIAADFMALIEQKLGIRFVQSPRKSWPELVDDVRNRNLDVFSMTMDMPSKRNYALFTEPYVSNAIMIVTQDTIEFIPGLNGLIGKPVAVGEGYAIQELLLRNHPELTIKTYPTTAAGLAAVSSGKAFAFIGNIAAVSYVMRHQGFSNLRVSGETPYHYELSMGVRNDWPELASILDKTLASISSQERAEIFSKWVHIEVAKPIPWVWIISATLILLLAIVWVLYWNYVLNQKVKQRTQMLEHNAHHDTLTGLPNRASLNMQLDQRIALADRNHTLLAVLFVDLDDFKKVNDTQGHSIGDQLLLAVALRLKNSLRRMDVISRFGGDEFVVIADNLSDKADIEAVCLNLLRAMKPTYMIGNLSINMRMSIGIATYPDDSLSPEDLLRNADIAMYASKSQGGDHFHFFSERMNRRIKRRIEVEEQMTTALTNGEFSLVLQPIICLVSNRPKKFEVLARWHNAKLGKVTPDEFIPLAEHNGSIMALGEYILEQSLAICARLRKQADPDMCITVNVSPRQLKNPGLPFKVRQLLEQNQLPPEALILEMTEGVLINHNRQTENSMAELTQLGVRLAMDDFGTGYSSLSYVRNFPFSILKIDREFVQDISTDTNSYELVEAVLAMARSMNIEVVAEGVETKAQEERLQALGCLHAQGYYYSKPLSEEELELWLIARQQITYNG
ncbi:MAG: EAL domain-containing protein [Reinekea sp.]